MCAHARKTKRIIWFFLHIQGCNLLTGRKSLKCSSKKEKKKKKREFEADHKHSKKTKEDL